MGRCLRLSILWALLLAGCSSDSKTTADLGTSADLAAVPDRGSAPDLSEAADLGAGDLAGPDLVSTMAESEPNNGGTETEFNTVPLWAVVTGAVGEPGDTDLFQLTAAAGDRFTATAASDGELQPHLTIFDTSGALPTSVNIGAGSEAMVEYYMLKAGTILIGLRDRRNVLSTPQDVGGPGFTYTLTVAPLDRAPVEVTVGDQLSATVAPAGTARVFAFEVTEDQQLSVAALAKQLSPPSEVDTRLSLFFVAQGSWHGTNDDQSLSLTDSLLEGKMPFTGTYHAIVENVNQQAGDLRIAIKISAP